MRLLSLLARDVLRAMFVSASVFRATTSSSKSTVSEGREVALSATSSCSSAARAAASEDTVSLLDALDVAKRAPSPPPAEAVSPGTPTTRDSWLVEPLPDVTPPHNSPPSISETKSGEEGLLEWIEENGASKFKDAILDVAGDLDDLKHITEQDFEDLVKGMPKLKARRLRASLVELGARLA